MTTAIEATTNRSDPTPMRTCLLPLGILSLSVVAALGRVTAQASPCAAHTDSASSPLDSAIVAAMRDHSVPGAAVAIVRDARVEHLGGYGCANTDRGVAVDPTRTVFHVASVSKPFVALAALQLAERGVVELHTDVNRYLRGMQVPAGWSKPVTLHDLLTHTAGFEESIVGYAARTPADVRPLGEFLAAKLPRRGWSPGDVTGYSNYGYALAGYVVESAAHVSFADYVRDQILQPLGMTRSSFAQPLPADLARDAAMSYRCTATACTAIQPDYRSAYPPGGLVTTAEDMSRFMLAELGAPLDGTRVISDSVIRWMQTRQFSHDPALPGLTYGFAEDDVMGARALSHAGGASGYSAFVALVPERHAGIFVVTNGGSSRFGASILSAIEQRNPWLAPTAAREVASLPSDPAVDPTGAYRLTRYAHRGVENLPALFNGQLHVSRVRGDTISVLGLGDADGRYIAVAPNRWRSVDGRDAIAVRAANGRITHLFGSVSFFGTRFPAAYERLAWYDVPHFLNELLSYVVAVPLLALVSWPIVAGIVWLVRRRTRLVARIRPALGASWRGPAVVTAVAATALSVWFGFGFIAVSNRAAERGGGEIVYGLPISMRMLAWAPAALALLALVLVVAAWVGWRRRWWSIPGLLIFTTVAASMVLFTAVLVHWGYSPVATG
jgi:CubicO group peptidase (beta-lactamase class C family)